MSNMTKKSLRKDCSTEEGLSCPFCGKFFPYEEGLSEEEIENQFFEHIECDHYYQIEEEVQKLSNLAEENEEAINQFIKKKKIEILQNASQTELELYNSDVSGMALKKAIDNKLWQLAFRQPQRLSTLDTKMMDSFKPKNGECPEGHSLIWVDGKEMCVPQSVLYEIYQYRAKREGVEQFKSHPLFP